MPFASFDSESHEQMCPTPDTYSMDKWQYMLAASTGAFAAIVATGGDAMIYFENLVASLPFT